MLLRDLLEMGGTALNHITVRRIKREEIGPTLDFIAKSLRIPNLTSAYMLSHLMGSAGKQADSGDLDIAMQEIDKRPFISINMVEFPPNVLRKIAARVVHLMGSLKYVNTDGINGGQLNTAWPINGEESNGFVQVDFIYGKAEWLKFSHHSPGKDISPYKGVFISTLLGVLAKFHKDYEEIDPNQIDPETGEPRIVRKVGLKYDIERGLTRGWKLQRVKGQGTSQVEPDEFETNTPNAPRFSRLGFVDNPEAVLSILFDSSVKPKDVDTFEKAWVLTKKFYPNQLEEIKTRLIDSLRRSGLKNDMSPEEIKNTIENLP